MSVRVRIAPSPTGAPHVGTAYIGLLNYCFARQHKGSFILRIEDTDRSRCTPQSEQAILAGLRWLGLNYDEGPDVGGAYGPYRQSERVAAGVYEQAAQQLLQQGDAYRCFCSSQRLEEVRQQQIATKSSVSGYDRHCRDLDPAEAERRAASGEAHVVRMKTPLEGTFSWPDRLRGGEIGKQWQEVDDQVLVKSDGWPTYHLAAVVDDHLMHISHVIRAEEWLNSLPKHVWLGQRLGYSIPEYVHVGLLRNADKSKISKRKNPTDLLWYKKQGYLPQALLNFLWLLGGSGPEAGEPVDLEAMVADFSLDRLSAGGPVFDLAKLEHLQGQYFRGLDDRAMQEAILAGLGERLPSLIPLLRDRMTFPADVTWLTDYLFAPDLDLKPEQLLPKGWPPAECKAALQMTVKVLKKALKEPDFTWTAECLQSLLGGLADSEGWKPRHYFMLLRLTSSGRANSLPLFESLEELGQTKTLARIEQALQLLR